MDQFSYASVMSFLKTVLKRRKMTYLQLSELIQVPESTLKKWFKSEDGTFNRLSMICDALGLTLNDVLIALEKRTVLTYQMPKKAQDALLKNKQALTLYWLLVYERMSGEKIKTLLKLTDSTYKRLLFKLDGLNLIVVDKNEKIKLPRAIPVRWANEGPLMKKLYHDWTKGLIDECLHDEDGLLFMHFFQLTEHSYREFLSELHLLEEKYVRRTIQELSTKGSELQKFRFVMATKKGRYPLDGLV